MKVEAGAIVEGVHRMFIDHRVMVGSTEIYDDELMQKGLINPERFPVIWHHCSSPPEIIGHFTLAPMPGCCGVVISTDSWLEPKWRGQQNVGIWFHELKAKTAQTLGYKVMLMTTHLRNIPEVVGASRAKWKFFHYFRNSRTQNDIGIAVKEL